MFGASYSFTTALQLVSVNALYTSFHKLSKRGRAFKDKLSQELVQTPEFAAFADAVSPDEVLVISIEYHLKIYMKGGEFKTTKMDWDNGGKCLQDTLLDTINGFRPDRPINDHQILIGLVSQIDSPKSFTKVTLRSISKCQYKNLVKQMNEIFLSTTFS